VSCEAASVDLLETNKIDNEAEKKITCVMKFGGSSVASAERMREVAELILSFPNESPVIVLSAMGKTTNKLLLVCLPSCLYFDFLLFYLFFEGKFFLIWST
jgi:aspartate kinase